MKVDRRFDERIWKAQREIVNAFSELMEDVSMGNLVGSKKTVELQNFYKEKANQAKVLLTNSIDLLENSGIVIPIRYPNDEKQDS